MVQGEEEMEVDEFEADANAPQTTHAEDAALLQQCDAVTEDENMSAAQTYATAVKEVARAV